MLQVEKRRSARWGVRLRVLFPWGDRILQAHTVDLSETGMRLVTLANLGKGTRLVMHFAPTGETITQRVEGEVVWVKPPTEPGGMFTCGFQFLAMAKEAQESIRQVIASQAQTESNEIPEASADDITEVEQEEQVNEAALWAVELRRAVHMDQDRQAERRRESEALAKEAKSASSAGSYNKAATLLEQALNLAPESRELMEELARILYLKGEVARAAELFDRALRSQEEG